MDGEVQVKYLNGNIKKYGEKERENFMFYELYRADNDVL
jgi:hypothetical protein